MKRFAVLLIVISAVAAAQSSNGYVYVAPGAVTCCGGSAATLHLGGGDILFAKGLGVNLDIGALAPRQHLDSAVGVFSPGGAYYFRRGKDLKLEPFVNGGYSLMFRSGHENLFYVGGGVNYWLARRVGLRLELRDHVLARENLHYWGLRLGLALR